MPRASWIDDDNHPDIDAHMNQLDHFAQSIADGAVDKAELDKQEQNLLAAMRKVEPTLSDDQHAAVTSLLAELTAYAVMQLLHEMAKSKIQAAIQ